MVSTNILFWKLSHDTLNFLIYWNFDVQAEVKFSWTKPRKRHLLLGNYEEFFIPAYGRSQTTYDTFSRSKKFQIVTPNVHTCITTFSNGSLLQKRAPLVYLSISSKRFNGDVRFLRCFKHLTVTCWRTFCHILACHLVIMGLPHLALMDICVFDISVFKRKSFFFFITLRLVDTKRITIEF